MSDQTIPNMSALDGAKPLTSIPIGLTQAEYQAIDSCSAVPSSTTIFEIGSRPGISISPKSMYMTFLCTLGDQYQCITGGAESLISEVRIETGGSIEIESCRSYGSLSHCLWNCCADKGDYSNLQLTQGGSAGVGDAHADNNFVP